MYKRLLSLLLVASFLICSTPLTAAAEESAVPSVSSTTEAVSDDGVTAPSVVEEIAEKRDESTKHFRMSDGSYLATQYALPVHYQDENDEWQEYDNRLQETADNTEYQNTKSDKDIRLGKKAKQNKMVTLTIDGHSISWGYEKINNSPAVPTTETTETALHVMQEVWYRNVYPSVDMQYILSSTGIKENIILTDNAAQHTFVQHYDIGHLTAVQTDTRTIALQNDKGETVYTIAAPVMTDAAAAHSTSLTLTIVKTNGNHISVELTADPTWLRDEKRVYPVTIDPYVQAPDSTGELETASLFGADTTSYPFDTLYVGHNMAYGRMGSVIKATMPQLNAGDMVVNAKLRVYQTGYTGSADVQVNVSRINRRWTLEQYHINDATVPAGFHTNIDAKIEDFHLANASTNNTYVYLDITPVVKGWYDDPATNYGVMLYPHDVTSSTSVGYARQSTTADQLPAFEISYVSNEGLEEYWTYHGIAASARGTAYVNDYTGNLTVTENVFSTVGGQMPLNLSLAYNVHNCHRQILYGAEPGSGFMFNFQQRVSPVIPALQAKGYKYQYTDADGTVLYFKQKNGSTTEWVDEVGKGLTITESAEMGGGTYLHFKDGTVLHFYDPYDGGTLLSAEDSYGNTIQYEQSLPCGYTYGYAITSITDGSGRSVSIAYEVVENIMRVKSITDHEGRTYSFSYILSSYTWPSLAGYYPSLLQTITYPDGNYTTFSYDEHGRMTAVTDNFGNRTAWTYAADSTSSTDDVLLPFTRISTITRYVSTNALIEEYTFTYNKDNTTSVVDKDGKRDEYQFDNLGRTTSVRYHDGSILNMGYTATASGSGTTAPAEVATNNRLSQYSSSERYVNNYAVNSSVESNTGFEHVTWDSSGFVSQSYDATVAYFGNRSLKICHDRAGMDFSISRQSIAITTSVATHLTFSAYVKTDNVTAVFDGYGATILIRYYDADNGLLGESPVGAYLSGTTDWTRISVTGELPFNTAKVEIQCVLRHATGTAWFDCLQLEAGKTVNEYNAIGNSNFDTTSGWSTTNFNTRTDAFTGNGQVTVKGEATANKYIYQYIPVNKTGAAFKLFATIEGAQAAQKSGRFCGIEADVYYEDGTHEYRSKWFNTATAAEQSVSYIFKPRQTTKKVVQIGVFYIVRNTANTTVLNNMMFTFDEQATTYGYDANGNLQSATDNAGRTQQYTYNANSKLTHAVDAAGGEQRYWYDSENPHQLNAVRNEQTGVGTVYTYDDEGNVIRVEQGQVNDNGGLVSGESVSTQITYRTEESETIYGLTSRAVTNGSNYKVTEIQTPWGGNASFYSDEANGMLKKTVMSATVRGANGPVDTTVETTYSYDNKHRLAWVTSGSAMLRYTYNTEDLLSEIATNGPYYGFNYDSYHNMTQVKLNGSGFVYLGYEDPLAAAGYSTIEKPENGLLDSVQFHNADRITYDYDGERRMITRVDNDGRLWHDYTDKGHLHRAKEWDLNWNDLFEIQYTYDDSDRLVRSNTTGNRKATVKYGYDTAGRLIEHSPETPSGTAHNTYTYNADGYLTKMWQGNFFFEYSYDTMGRLIEETVSQNGTIFLENKYAYIANTTLVRTKKRYQGTTLKETLTYTYDIGGNISSVQKNGTTIGSYQYDTLGQLSSDGTYTYTYAANGNLLTVKQNGTTVKTYGYDSVWTDQLVSFNGNSISYDLAGNPIRYYDGTQFTWNNGHELWALQKGSTSATYTYDAYGKRITKKVNGTTTQYYYDDADNLFAAGNVFIFYGPNGEAMSIKYNGTRYYLVKNLQGDVTGLADTSGNLVAQYTYDAWGKPLTITDGNGTNVKNNASHIANLNPLRYRSYVYDNESGFYYLMSRYYDPTTGRFLSPDGQLNLSTMHGCNLYAYCENDPVNYVDPTGRSAILALFVITAVSGFFACASPAGQARTEEAFNNPSFYSIGNWLTLGTFEMVKGAVAPAQPFSAQHWIDSAGTAMLLIPAIGFADDVARGAFLSERNALNSIGSPFSGIGSSQIGVDPNTLKLNPNFIPNPVKYNAALKQIKNSGMYGVIEVSRSGLVYNGQHRVLIAQQLGISVDVVIR